MTLARHQICKLDYMRFLHNIQVLSGTTESV